MRISDWSSDVCSSDLHAEALVLGELVEDVGRRRDRVRPEEHRQLRQLPGSHEAPGQRGVAVDVRVGAGRLDRRSHLVGVVEQLRGLTEGVAGLEGGDVRVPHQGLGRELLLRSEEHTSELQSLMRNSYAVFCLKKTKSHSK